MTETSLVLRPLIAAAFSGLIAASVMPANAAKRQPPAPLRASPRRCRRHRHGRRWHLFTNKQCSQILD
jgi:hypothetical protein